MKEQFREIIERYFSDADELEKEGAVEEICDAHEREVEERINEESAGDDL